jgi:hypothetical protein
VIVVSSSAWTWFRATVAVVSFAAWTTQLILAGFGPDSVFSVTAAPGGVDAVVWFSPLVPISATLYWFVRRVRTPVASFIAGLILAVLSGLSLVVVVSRLPGADQDGMLSVIQFWQFAMVLLVVVGLSVGASKEWDRKALQTTPVRPDQLPLDLPPPAVPASTVQRRHWDVLGMFIKFAVVAGVVVLIWYIWALSQIEF